jgi:cation-transporting ATPase E
VPWAQRFFQLQLEGWRDPLTGVAIALVAGVLLEVVWRRINLAAPQPAPTPAGPSAGPQE